MMSSMAKKGKILGQLHKSVDAHNLPNQKSCSSGT